MKRIRVVMSKFVTKTKTVSASPAALATITAVCAVVGTIPVPGVQTVCTGITEFIKMMEGAHANDEQWTVLLEVMQRYAKRLENFTDSVSHNQPDNYLVDSTDKVAVDAREAIQEFTKQITDAKDKIEAKRNERKLKKHLGASAIKDEIRECRQALADALEDFNGRVSNIIVRSTVKSESTVMPEPYDIPGAKTIKNGDFRIVQDFDYHTADTATFWENLRSVDLGDNQVFVAKMYITKSSKEEFKKDMEFFADNLGPKIARLFGYNTESRHPYIIFSFASVRPMMRYLLDLSQEDYQGYLIKGWRLFQDLQKAGKFLCDQSGDINRELRRIGASIKDAAVGSHDQLVLAPPCDVNLEIFGLERGHGPTEWMIDRFWVKRTRHREDQRIRAIRPFALALQNNMQKFLEYDTHGFTSPSQVSTALRGLWPDLKERWLDAEHAPFPDGVTAGDVGVLSVGENGAIQFQYLANIAEVFDNIRFIPPQAETTDFPNIYRATCYGKIDEPNWDCWQPWITWGYILDEQKVDPTVLARQFKIIGKRYGVRPTSLVMTRRAQYEMEMGDANPMRDKLQTGQPIYCYATFGDNWQFQGARWSFHPRPPSEEEAAAEVSVLEPLNCPALWTTTRPWAGIPYWQFEDEDFEFYLKNSGDEEEIARIEEVEETSGSSLPKLKRVTGLVPVRT